jgi:surfactin synthase thioesterase subunit
MVTRLTSSRWLLRKPSDDFAARVFCFPYSGVGASMFNRWPRALGTVEVCAIQLPGRENRLSEPHYGTYEQLAAELADALLPYLDRPAVFFGHCAGALPAFETATLLVQRGARAPHRLVVSAQVAPHDCPHDRYLGMTADELREEMERLTVSLGGQVHPVIIDLTLGALREDLKAVRAYRRSEPLRMPFGLSVLHWNDDTEVTQAQLQGWEHYSEDVCMTVLDGGHYAFLSAPQQLLDLLREVAL